MIHTCIHSFAKSKHGSTSLFVEFDYLIVKILFNSFTMKSSNNVGQSIIAHFHSTFHSTFSGGKNCNSNLVIFTSFVTYNRDLTNYAQKKVQK
jgi:hypothetical protein